MSITDQIDPPWQTAIIYFWFLMHLRLFSPRCITDMSQVYFSSVKVRKSCKYIHSAVGEAYVNERSLLRTKQMERNNSESNMHFAKIFIVGH